MNIYRTLPIFFVALFLTGLVSASFQFSNGTIEMSYFPNELLKGPFSMNFSNHGNADFSSSLGGSISLLDFLNKSGYVADQDFTCIPSNCRKPYTSSNPESSKSVQLSTNQTLGFVVTGNTGVEISDLSFRVSSNIQSSCSNQLSIDLFDDNSTDFHNTNYLDIPCASRNFGCFDSSSSLDSINIGSTAFCEKIDLAAAPAYRIGGNITKGTNQASLLMTLYNYNSSESLGDCQLNVTQSGFNDCIVNYSSTSNFSSFVCISTDVGQDYTIRSETDSPCGMEGADSSQPFQLDYELYAVPLKYGSPNIRVDSDSYQQSTGNELITDIQDYLSANYDSECPSPGCVIPITFSGLSQVLTIDSINLSYSYSGASSGTKKHDIYNVVPGETIINSSNLDFELKNLGFTAPNSSGERTFRLSFDGSTLLTQQINVTPGFAFNVTPKFSLLKQPTLFRATLSDDDVLSSSWDFGDGSDIKESTSDSATHIYNQSGDYTIEVTASTSDSTSKRSFLITVGDAKTSANLTLVKYAQRLSNITSQVRGYPSWISDEINQQLNLTQINLTISMLSSRFANATNDSDYLDISNSLSSINVPIMILTTERGIGAPVSLGFNNINLDLVEAIKNITISDKDKLKSQLIGWNNNNYNSLIDFSVISQLSDSGQTPLLTQFDLKLNSKGNETAQYLFIDYPSSAIIFKENYQQSSVGQGAYIPISNNNEIEFAIADKVQASSLGAFLIPSDLSNFDTTIEPPVSNPYPWKWVIIYAIIALFILFVLYGILQIWYRRHYESYLFKNKDDLFNLINFIYNSRVSGLVDSEIRTKLGKAAWSLEQISYAFKKIDGKRTGMLEIPIFNLFDHSSMKKELAKKHPDGIDGRFIKRY